MALSIQQIVEKLLKGSGLSGLFAITLVLGGCGVEQKAQEITDQSLQAIDQAIDALQSSSADWQQVLKDTEAKLASDAQSTVRNDVAVVLSRTLAQGGVEFRCDVDFINERVREDLIEIKAKLLKQPVPAKKPAFCHVVPIAVDASIVPQQIKQLEFYGYNFDYSKKLRLRLVNTDGSSKDVTDFIAHPSSYAMTLPFGATGVQLSNASLRFVLDIDDTEISSVSIVQPQTVLPICGSKPVQIFQLETQKTIGPLVPPKVGRGDDDFNGNGPDVNATVNLVVTSRSLTARVYMDAREVGGDGTEAQGWFDRVLYEAEPNWRIDHVDGATHSQIHYRDSNTSPDHFSMGPGDLISQYTFVGDTGGGGEAGSKTSVTLYFNPLYVTVTQVGNCLPGPAIQKLIDSHQIGPESMRALQAKAQRASAQRRASMELMRRAVAHP